MESTSISEAELDQINQIKLAIQEDGGTAADLKQETEEQKAKKKALLERLAKGISAA